MSTDLYNRQGEPMTQDEWVARFGDKAYKVVAYEQVGVSGELVGVSTVWLGMDHNYGDGPPLIFETLVFGGSLDQEMDRYSTEAEAVAGHAAMVAKVRAS